MYKFFAYTRILLTELWNSQHILHIINAIDIHLLIIYTHKPWNIFGGSLRINVPLFSFSFSSSLRMYLLSSFLTFVCSLVVSLSCEVVAEPELESPVVIVIVGYFFPNNVVIGYTATETETTIHQWTPCLTQLPFFLS